ncbi:MAG: genomic island protein [Alteromonas sp.]|nr:genomic island protein [Alteromonas sp.]
MKNKLNETQIAKDNWDRYVRARDAGHSRYVREATRFDEFYMGEQWSDEDRSRLEEEGRPALTINHILSTVNAAIGEQAGRRADITFKPRRGKASQAVAEVLTKTFEHILDENDYQKCIEHVVYSDGLIQDRGYIDVRIDTDESVLGEIRLNTEDPITVIPDPQSKSYDPRQWNEVFITRWMSVDEVESKYGREAALKVKNHANAGNHFGPDSITVEQTFGDSEIIEPTSAEIDDGRSTIKGMRIIERQYFKRHKTKVFMDPRNGEHRPVPESWDEERIAAAVQSMGLNVVEKRVKRVRWCVTIDNVVITDEWSPYRTFTIIPFFPYFRRGKPFGMVRNLISPQEFLNKSRSQELHIVNTTANSGWMVEDGALTNMTEEELAENGAKSGLVIVHRQGAEPQKIKPNPVPTGIDRISTKGQLDIKEISGVNDSMLGIENAEVSGVALEQKTSRGQVQLQVPGQHLAMTHQILARKVLELIQDFYTEERILQITDYNEPEQPREEVGINQIDPFGQIINDVTVGDYDVVVADAPARDTFDEMQFAESMALKQAGINIPDHVIIENSHLSNKANIARMVKEMAGLGEPSPEQLEIEQFQKEAVIKTQELELAKIQAEIELTKAKAHLEAIKAQDTSEGQFERQERQIEATRELKEAELDVRVELADKSNSTNITKQQLGNTAKLAGDAMKVVENRSKEAQKPTGKKDGPR